MEAKNWVSISGLEGRYSANTEGAILNLKTSHVLSPVVQSNGYCVVYINNGETKKLVRVHRLIAKTFLPQVIGKEEVNHLNGIKTDNRAANLAWCNASENQLHALRTGLKTVQRGEQVPWSKLSTQQVEEIKQRYAAGGVSQRALGDAYGLDQSMISLIVRNKRWQS